MITFYSQRYNFIERKYIKYCMFCTAKAKYYLDDEGLSSRNATLSQDG